VRKVRAFWFGRRIIQAFSDAGRKAATADRKG
jgi:hypothetical protein